MHRVDDDDVCHPEGAIVWQGKILARPRGHDCAYVEAVNELIPEAEEAAHRDAGPRTHRAIRLWRGAMARAFVAHMDRLVLERLGVDRRVRQ